MDNVFNLSILECGRSVLEISRMIEDGQTIVLDFSRDPDADSKASFFNLPPEALERVLFKGLSQYGMSQMSERFSGYKYSSPLAWRFMDVGDGIYRAVYQEGSKERVENFKDFKSSTIQLDFMMSKVKVLDDSLHELTDEQLSLLKSQIELIDISVAELKDMVESIIRNHPGPVLREDG